jgi:phage terminase large subunit
MQTSSVFDWNFNSSKYNVVNAGGTSSGKTVSIMQAIGVKLIQSKLLCTVVGADVPKLKKGALRDFQDFVLPFIKHEIKEYNKTERIYLFHNGSQLEFNSYIDAGSAHNGKRDILFINEANLISWQVVWQLVIRTRIQCFYDFNPSAKFWVHENIIEDFDRKKNCDYFISDHRHNPFLNDQTRMQIESIKDPNMFKVYARGQLGTLSGQVYNWTEYDVLPQCNSVIWGVDYGYTNDPTALVKVSYNKVGRLIESFYVQELLYTAGISASGIFQQMKEYGYKNGQILYSEHDTAMVRELRSLGALVVPAVKKDLDTRILWMKKQNIYYSKNSTNLKNEVSKCLWLENKDSTNENDKYLNRRMDAFDHLINATEYALYSAHIGGRM